MPPKSGKALVIVESPTKARTISKFLPQGFVVEASVGHIRDLPAGAKEVPTALKGQSWARLGIDVDNDFQPLYVVPAAKKKQVTKLKQLVKDADEIYLATDEDREGESISWHLVEVLKPKVPLKRLVFHEITKGAIQKALEEPRDLHHGLIQAQETRRILDRLVGYEVSPILWRKIGPGLSAGRVQSVAVRLIVERERERQRFVEAVYWDLVGTFGAASGSFDATLKSLDGKRVASGKDFDDHTGRLKPDSDAVWVDAERAARLVDDLSGADWKVSKLENKPFTNRPSPPFTTSTLQQEANRKLRLSARATMQAAQRLYENGYITYMRTDSTTLSSEAVASARAKIEELYGSDYVPAAPRTYANKVKNAQEAHEAIRPSSEFHTPDAIRGKLGADEIRVYELIWKRTMACQMADAKGFNTRLEVSGAGAVFGASGKTIEFPGFLRAYVEGADDPGAELADKESVLPAVAEGETLEGRELTAKDHTTQPPARFTEASLVKELEANGVGRPSTYASIIDTIIGREYVVKKGTALVPTFMAFAVVGLLERYFTHLVDVDFTARMEDDLDKISLGQMEAVPYLRHFYFGEGQQLDGASEQGLKRLLDQEIDARTSCTLPLGEDPQGRGIAIRIGRYGPYLEREEERASIPEGLAPDELSLEKAVELLEKGSGPTELGVDPDSGRNVYVKTGRFGPYVQLGENGDDPKPTMKSLLPGMEPEEVSLDQALRLLRLPREVGVDPATNEPVLADFGRYGPYLKRGSDTRSLGEPEQIFTIQLDAALEILAQEKKSSFRRQPKTLRELGNKPDGVAVKMLEGRYGPYVTDGETNASVPKGTDPSDVTLEQAIELLVARAAAGPRRKKKKAAKKAAKKATKKAAKKATKKASKKAVKKVARKKAAEDEA